MSEQPGSDIFLFWGSGSPPCWRVMLALEEKGLVGYKHKLLSFGKKEHKSEEVLKLNPRGQVPTLCVGDLVLNESLAAIDYLEMMNPGKGTVLHPTNPGDLAKVLQRKFEVLNLYSKGTEGVAYPIMKGEDASEEKKQAFRDELQVWEDYLKQEGEGSFLAGTSFSMADVVFFPQLAFYVRVGLKLTQNYPSLNSYYNLICQRPSVKNTWPPHWKESDGPSSLSDL